MIDCDLNNDFYVKVKICLEVVQPRRSAKQKEFSKIGEEFFS